MVGAVKIGGLDRGEWILTAYLVVVASSGVLPLALLVVEVGPQPGGALALTVAALVALIAAGIVWQT
jgi:hypothetical protein